ncbi:UDP-glucose 4-epimerase GalE [Porticoccus sp.]|uniref:UDP-glucose 4-epimerase GalE n=1 Tax=Porticoccus sp. TaxID=2024853 RepID=UPI003F6A2373
MKVLVTGGAGYIGSHACVALLETGHDIVVLDNFSNSCIKSLDRVKQITGKDFPVFEGDVNHHRILDDIFNSHTINAVMHFAGYKAVGESCEKPLLYYRNNVAGALTLCEAMQKHQVSLLIFSSSATVYGDPTTVPIKENFPLSATNPYGRSKLMVEEILRDLVSAEQLTGSNTWQIGLLRYFNPVGAHPSGLIGEDPNGIPNNLLPYISQVAIGRLPVLSVFGSDYPTVDGTGIRDYLHVTDLAEGHVRALDYLAQSSAAPGCHTWNLGTGKGYSVLEMIRAFESVSGKTVAFKVAPRRAGDIAECWADTSKAERELGWTASRGLPEMMADSWRWQLGNPDGYRS